MSAPSEALTFQTSASRKGQLLNFAAKAHVDPDWIIERALDFGLPLFFQYYSKLFSANAEKTEVATAAALGTPTLEIKRKRGRPPKIKEE